MPPRMVRATLVYLPAVWLTVGLGVALFGLVPRATPLVWTVIAYAGLIGTPGRAREGGRQPFGSPNLTSR